MRKFQVSMIDLIWVMGLVACIAAGASTYNPDLIWGSICCLLFFFWYRPVMLRFWILAMLGIGSGICVSGKYGNDVLSMNGGELVAWGVAMIVVGIVSFYLFDIRKPQLQQETRRTPVD